MTGSWRLALVALLVAAPVSAEIIDKDFHESFDVQPGARLYLDHGDGDVVITPWDRDVIDVVVRYHAEIKRMGFGSTRDFDVEFRQSGDTVRVIGREEGWGVSFGFHSEKQYEYRYTVQAPSWVELELRGDDGDVRVSDWRANVDGRLDDGDVFFENLEAERASFRIEDGDLEVDGFVGELSIEADDGDVEVNDCRLTQGRFELEDGNLTVTRCEGALRANSDDGDVELAAFKAGDINVRVSDGSVELELLVGEVPEVDLRSDDGRIVVDLESGISAALTVDTDDGAIRFDLPSARNVTKGESRLTGELGDGSGRIRVVTGDGSVTLREIGG